MGASLRKLDDEPILIVTHEGQMTLKSVEEITQKVVQAMDEAATPLYGIIDLRQAQIDFPEFLRIVAHQSIGARGTLSHRETYVVLVGENFFLRLFRALMSEHTFGGVTLAVYYTMDEALAAVRLRIKIDGQRAG